MEGAVLFHKRGNLKQAEAGYRHIINQDPGNSEALHLLGLIAYQLKK